jgi:hypothetical protein
MATVTPNFNWPVPTSTDLVKDGATAIEALGDSIDGSLVDLKGGTTGQVLSKTSGTDMDFTWVTTDDANAIQNSIVDAKGDLIAASANDTPARLAVGNNGETLVADSSQAVGLRYNPQNALANPIINGGFDIWQRGTSFTITNNYTADRWYKAGNPSHTFSRQATNDTTNLPNVQYCLRAQRDSGATGLGIIQLANSVETANSVPFAGKTITMSFYARAGANYSAASNILKYEMRTGTGTDQSLFGGYTGSATIISTNATLTTTWQRFTTTATVGATATEFCVYFESQPVGTAGANDYFEVTGVQIDLGTYTASTAPAFRRSGGTIQGELAACQRYYYALGGTASNSPLGTALTSSTTVLYLVAQPPVTMRTTPTIDQTTGTNYYVAVSKVFNSWTGIDQASTRYVELYLTTSGLTAGQAGYARVNASGGYLALSAEL